MSKRLAPFASPARPSPLHSVQAAPPDPSAVRAFVGAEESAPSRLRRSSPGERVGAYLPPELVHALRHAALDERRSVSDALTEAVREWLERRSSKAL